MDSRWAMDSDFFRNYLAPRPCRGYVLYFSPADRTDLRRFFQKGDIICGNLRNLRENTSKCIRRRRVLNRYFFQLIGWFKRLAG